MGPYLKAKPYKKPDVVVIDSIQTMYSDQISSAPGSVSQVREATGVLLQLAKGLNISVFIDLCHFNSLMSVWTDIIYFCSLCLL